MNDFQQKLLQNEQPLRIHLIGVAGSGMSGLALLLLGMGHRVSGSDKVTSKETERLQGLGLIFSSPHTAEAVADADIVVYSSAIRPTNPAYAAAQEAGILLWRRAECLAAILHTRKGIVISGTHGKTTTSSMTAHLLREAGLSPSHYVGAEIPILGANAKWSTEGEFMVAEGDESDGTLALYHPEHTLMLNIEAEHLDFYRDLDHICSVFKQIASQTRGNIVFCKEDPVAAALNQENPRGVSYGWDNAHFTARNLRELRGSTAFTVFHHDQELGDVELGIPGRHNVLNALGAIAMATLCGADFPSMARALSTFAGAKRRFETKFLSPQLRIVDDYGHHPSELAATLQTARSLQPKRIVVAFQPHRFTRTQALADDFGKVLQAADLVFVTDIYPASETPIPGITGDTIVQAMQPHGNTPAHFLPDFATAHHAIGNALQPGDLLITLGAGNIHELGTKISHDWKILEDLTNLAPRGEILTKLYEPLRRHTTMLAGGPAQFWIEPQSFTAFQSIINYCRDLAIPTRVIGRGSNLLIRDGGIRGAVIHPSGGEFSAISVNGNQITSGAGVRLKKLASTAAEAQLGRLEWMEGIPGNVGGSLRMNAGAMGLEMFDHVVSIKTLDEDGAIRNHSREEFDAQYRNTPRLRRNFVLQATFEAEKDDPEAIQQRWQLSREKRRTSQPIAASSGCTFKNPSEIPAGKLVDELGLKGHQIGNAAISDVHGNFFCNLGKAKTADIIELIELTKSRALHERNIELETEVKILGEDEFTF